MPSQKEIHETLEDVESSDLFYHEDRYTCGPVAEGPCYEDLLPPKVLDMRRRKVRRVG